ncbi:hypothetical protein [uncultured Litoreibacter sp.]|uniref:hypothetical protein n=1 Tax=uncultured Litoreibacter sp. TaxID=1392394 RepID=UPI00262604DC|nr:hypothetical protein [uncultured Litoreibacter sp.]
MSTRPDLTRWNRAGLRRFDYVDGDAAVWLDKLRAALVGMYGRGAEMDSRMAADFDKLFLEETPEHERDAIDIEGLRAGVLWQRLRETIPPAIDEDGTSHKLETRGQRKLRLDAQYGAAADGDQAWEIMRAFARATHVTMGHLDAFSNEGYLRTATQWDNLRRLAALVNYQPTPAASATTTVALSLKPDLDVVEVAAGLAMKHQPPKGQPLIFETMSKLVGHPDLNAAMVDGWDVNGDRLRPGDADLRWEIGEKTNVAPGDVAILTDGRDGAAGTVTGFERDAEDGPARVDFDAKAVRAFRTTYHDARLLLEPADLIIGEPRQIDGYTMLYLEKPAGFRKGDLVLMRREGELDMPIQILAASGSKLLIQPSEPLQGVIEILPMAPIAKDKETGAFNATDSLTMYFATSRGLRMFTANVGTRRSRRTRRIELPVPELRGKASPIYEKSDEDGSGIGAPSGVSFIPSDPSLKLAFAPTSDAKPLRAKVVGDRTVLGGAAQNTVEFLGKPPKGLTEGDWFVSRSMTNATRLRPLRVQGVRLGTGRYSILFHDSVGQPDRFEFLGPMKTSVTAVGHGRNPDTFGEPAKIMLCGLSDAATDILRPGRQVIINAIENGFSEDVAASLVTIEPRGDGKVEITLQAERSFDHFTKGDTVFRMNAVKISHGESKGPKTLGSGDGERPRQHFTLQVGEISHVPSPVSESGVIPALDVAVDGEVWPYADYIDPAAEGTRSWSTTLGEDGYLRIHFRRRLPTGTNNVGLIRHRVGVGLKGSRIPPCSFTKPMKKTAYVSEIHQPFSTSGGADREPVESLRSSAPSRLSSNGRAVSLRDFERLTARHASVWRARAEEIATATRSREIMMTIVPAGGAELGLLEHDLRAAILARAIPGVVLSFQPYTPILLRFAATVRADLTSYDQTDLQGACEDALRGAFALQERDFAQPAYVSEALAALESVHGIENAIISGFDYTSPTGIEPQTVAINDGTIATIFPRPEQVAHIGDLSEVGANSVLITVKDIHDPID